MAPNRSRATFEPLGKVFLSHSSVDKPFVRRLHKKLADAGVDLWLDEKILLGGDSLPRKIAAAVSGSRALLVVVSSASLESDWLRYELQIAIPKSIKGECLLIPLLIEDVSMPAELGGVVYVDCRKGKKGYAEQILKSLEQEAKRRRRVTASMESDQNAVRSRGISDAVREVFDGVGWASMDLSATRSLIFDVLEVQTKNGRTVDVVYDTLMDYGGNPVQSFTVADWEDWERKITEEIGERFGLLISELAPARELQSRTVKISDGVWIERLPASQLEAGGALIFVHLGLPISDDETRSRLRVAYERLQHEVRVQVQPLPSSLEEAFARLRKQNP